MTQVARLALVGVILVLACGNAVAANSRVPKVRTVTFDGNTTYSAARLEGLMLTRPSRFLAPGKYHPEVFADDLDNLVAFYRQNGFLQAQVTDTTVAHDSTANTVDIVIDFDEGLRTFIDGVTIFGNEYFADSALSVHAALQRGDPLRRPVIEDAVVTLLSLYAEHGFLDAAVTPQVQVNDSLHLAIIDIAVREGPQSRVGDIIIDGNKRTRSHIITRELGFYPNDTIRFSALLQSQRRLYLTGLFESVFVRPVPSASGELSTKDIRIEIKEKQSSELSFTIGYGTVEKIRGRTELNTINLAGTARKAGISLEANFIRQGVSASFSEPWTLGTRWRTDFNLYGQFRQEPGYHADVIGGKVTIGRKLGSHTNISLAYRLENTNLSRVDVTAEIEELDPRIRSLALSVTHDTRDNLFDPSAGWYAGWTNEIAGSFLQGSNTFARSVLTLKRFHPLGRSSVLGSALELGWTDYFGDDQEIPLSERFYAGGPMSLRGFGYQMVGPMDVNGEPLGGQIKIVWNLLELRQSVYRMIGGALFVDIGNVWSRPENVSLDDLRIDVGAGLRANSPLGIIRLDYGINLDRRADEPRTRIFASMGQAF